MTVMITGATGFLGPYLMDAFCSPVFGLRPVGVSKESKSDYRCDLTDLLQVSALMRQVAPDLVIHAAAATDVAWCQANPQEAMRANVEATKNIVQTMPKNGRLIYISSDMVYSGPGPHKEFSSSENPLNIYGMSKYLGEMEARKFSNHLVIRTSMYGFGRSAKNGLSLVDFLVGKMRSGEQFSIFTDVMFSALSVETLSHRLVQLAGASSLTGTYNLGARGGMSKAKFALLLADGLGLSAQMATPVESASISSRIPRPLDMRMDSTNLRNSDGVKGPFMADDLAEMCKVHHSAD